MSEASKLIVEVKAAIIPGRWEEKFTRRFTVSSKEWEDAEAADAAGAEGVSSAFLLVAFRAAEADEYARFLRNGRFNVVSTEWTWL